MAGNANRNVSVDITGDTRDLEQSYDRVARKSDEIAKKQEDNNRKLSDGIKRTADITTGSFDGMSAAASTFGKTGPLAIGAVGAALVALPAVINLAAGALTLGFGGALAGIGIAAATQSAAVRGEFKALWDDIAQDTYDISGPIQDALVNIAGYARDAFSNFKPYLEEAFELLGPAIDRFGENFSRAFLELSPSIEPLSVAFGKLLDALGMRAPAIFGSLSRSIENLADIANRNADDIAGFFEGAFGALEWTTEAMNTLSQEWDHALATWEDQWNNLMATLVDDDSLQDFTIDIYNNTDQWNLLAEQIKNTANQIREAQYPTEELKLDVDALTESINELNGVNINADAAMLAWAEKLYQAAEAAKGNTEGLKLNTEAGRANWEQVLGMAEAGNRLIQAKAEEGATARELAGTYGQLQTDMLNVLKSMGLSSEEARKLTKRYLEIPDEIRTQVGLETLEAQRKFDEYITLNSGRQIPVYLIQKQEMPAKDGGYFGYASGGPVRGPGSSRSDSIPARISRGEYVVNAAATRRNLPLLEAINSGKGVGGMGTTIIYQINTSVAPTANLSAIGQEIVESIQAFESRSGKTWRSN